MKEPSGGDDFSQRLNTEITRAAAPAYKSHPKWPLISSRVTIPSGIYHAYHPVQLRSGVEIVAESQGSVAIISHLEEGQNLFWSDPGDELYAVKLKNFHAVAAKKFNGNFMDIHNANRNCIFEELFVEQFARGMALFDSFTAVIRDVNIYMCRAGILASNMTNGRWSYVKVENCAEHGIELTNRGRRTTTGMLLDGVVSQGNGRAGLLIDGIDQARIVGLFVEGNNRIKTRVAGDSGDYAQIVLQADREKLNRRNGNIFFDSIFVTPGHSVMENTTAIRVSGGENIVFNGGLVRSFSNKIGIGFHIEDGVNVCEVSNMTFERMTEDQIFRSGADVKLIARNNTRSGKLGEPYIRLPDIGG